MAQNTLSSVFRAGAEYGLPFGFYLSVMSACFLYSSASEWVNAAALAMFIMCPVFMLKIQNLYIRRTPDVIPTFGSQWLVGALSMSLGSVLCGLFTYVLVATMMPDFLYDQAQAAVDMYRQIPSMKGDPMVTNLQTMIKSGMLPSNIQYVLLMIWFTVMSSMVIASITAAFSILGYVRAINKRNNNNQQQ